MRLLSAIPSLFCLCLLTAHADDGGAIAGEKDLLPKTEYRDVRQLVETRIESRLYRSWSENKATISSSLIYSEMPRFGAFQQWRSQLNSEFMRLNTSFQDEVSTLTSDVSTRKKELKYQSFKDFRRISFQRNSGFSVQKD